MKKAEREQLIAEKVYWQGVGQALGLQLHGWTGRREASFFLPDGSVFECPAMVADRVLALSRKETP